MHVLHVIIRPAHRTGRFMHVTYDMTSHNAYP